MTTLPIIIIGAGGHARVIADALVCAGSVVAGFVDKDDARKGQDMLGLPVMGGEDVLARFDPDAVRLVVGIGSVGDRSALELRQQISERLRREGWTLAGVRHPTATISPTATVAADAQIMAGAIVQVGADVGEGAIVNTKAVVEHDSVVGAYSHISIGTVLCGDTRIGSCSHVGAGAIVRQGVSLGDGITIGIGAVVVSNHEGGATLIGNPAKEMTRT